MAESLPEGLTVQQAIERLTHFCENEYVYYDAIYYSDPNRIEPIDVFVTVAVNSFVTNAAQARRIHSGLAQNCEKFLLSIPKDADLRSFDPDLELLAALLHQALQVQGVLIPVATKVLYRKRRSLIPMLDNVVIGYYLNSSNQEHLLPQTQDKRKAASVAAKVLKLFRSDLTESWLRLVRISESLSSRGYNLTPLRILEILIWTAVEERGYYRGSPNPRERLELRA